MKSWIAGVAVLAVLFGVGHAQGSIATFNTDLQGWAGVGGTATQVGVGGNPGGYLELLDSASGNMYIHPSGTPATTDFLGDLTAFDRGSLSFDAKFISGGTPTFSGFGRVTLTDGVTSLMLDFAPTGDPPSTWTTYSMPFTSAAWGVSQASWTTVLGSVTDLQIRLEFVSGHETVGVDNVTLAPIPEPSTLLIWSVLGALGVAFGLRRRKLGR